MEEKPGKDGLTRSQRRERNQQAKEDRGRLFPHGDLHGRDNDGGAVILRLPAGEEWLEVRARGKWFHFDSDGEWSVKLISLGDPVPLGRFIHALICRYNEQVRELNRLAGVTMLGVEEFRDGQKKLDAGACGEGVGGGEDRQGGVSGAVADAAAGGVAETAEAGGVRDA